MDFIKTYKRLAFLQMVYKRMEKLAVPHISTTVDFRKIYYKKIARELTELIEENEDVYDRYLEIKEFEKIFGFSTNTDLQY